MNRFQKIEAWGDAHQSKWLALLRMLLGLIIFTKGVYFIQNRDEVSTMIENSAVSIYAVFLAHYVAMAHLMGGILITIGLITRIAILFQIPILIGAVVFINAQKGFYSMHSDLWLSIVVLMLLIFFLIFGSGNLSVDKFMSKHEHT